MKSSSLTIVLVAAALFFGFIGTAAAVSIPADLAIDFRDGTWQDAQGKLSITEIDDDIKVQAEVDNGGKLTWESGLDLGIEGGWSSRVNRKEIFEIDFDKNKDPVSYSGLWLTDFSGKLNRLKNKNKFQIELQFESNGTTKRKILNLRNRVTDYGKGLVHIDLLDEDFSKFNEIDIQLNDDHGNPDKRIKFRVAGLEKNEAVPTPEPATMLLLGAGLIGLAGFGRKKILRKNQG